MESTNPEEFQTWITDVVKSIYSNGFYSINNHHEHEQLEFKSFYDDNLISKYNNKNILYI